MQAHSFVARSIVGWGSRVGEWCRIEGTSNEPNPNAPNARMGLVDLFNDKGQLNPSVTVIGMCYASNRTANITKLLLVNSSQYLCLIHKFSYSLMLVLPYVVL